MAKRSDFGQAMRVVPGTEQNFTLCVDADMLPHFHAGELRRIYAQVVECPCGFWQPIGACCPACGRHGQHA